MYTKTFAAQLNEVEMKLDELKNSDLIAEYKAILQLTGTKLYLKLNVFKKKIGVI